MLVVIAGPAGTGKTTVADQLADAIGAPHVDFDTAGAGLLEAARADRPHEDVSTLLADLREVRYEALAEAVRTALSAHPVVIASAPFTRHVADPRLWAEWLSAADPRSPSGAVALLWLDLEPAERWRRLMTRGSDRDGPALANGPDALPAEAPAVPCTVLDASADPQELLRAALAAIARGASGPIGDSV